MEKTLAKQSDFLKLKYKFFINRIVTYFSFLLIPIWLQQTQTVNFLMQSIILIMYMSFMVGQWYMFGKEIDHRLKIYYRVNSSMDRTLYRIFMGSMIMMFLFSLVSLFPTTIVNYFFWTFFGVFGVFYSWPTRGKVIEDSMTNQFGEIKFLDSFEKTVFLLSALTFAISLPELPMFENIEALKIYFDPNEKVSGLMWSYLSVLYHPFIAYPKLYNLIWSFHFYFFGIGFYLVALYGLLRHFVSRRLSMLGLFSVISTWSFAKILSNDYFNSITTTSSLLWVWSVLWATNSATYRSGLFTGLICTYLTVINGINILLFPLTLILFYFFLFNGQTPWFKRQWVKYNIFGFVISLLVLSSSFSSLNFDFSFNLTLLQNEFIELIYRKAFFVIAPIGFVLSLIFLIKKTNSLFTVVSFDVFKLKEIMFCIVSLLLMGMIFNVSFIKGFSLIWILSFFALIPLEWIFQSISRLRSKRNLIYALYILVCLLDSHLENRIRIIGKMFLDEDLLKYLIQL